MSGTTAGQGAAKRILDAGGPRLLGLAQAVLGALLLGINVAFIFGDGRYYVMLFILGLPLLTLGLWTVITGKTNAVPTTGPKPPLWWTVGFYVLLVMSVCFALYLAIHLKKPDALDFLFD